MPSTPPVASSDAAKPGSLTPEPDFNPEFELVIRARTGWIGLDWAEIFRYRELLYFLIWRDIKIRYKQTVLGFAWAVLQPLLQAIISTIIFGLLAGMKNHLPQGVPYLLFAFVGQLPWQFFAVGMNAGGMSLVNQQHLLTKIYFPRVFLPAASIGGGLFDLLMGGIVVSVFLVYFHFTSSQFTPPWTVALSPLLAIPAAIASLGIAYTLSALTVTYRDFRFLIPLMAQIWMLVSFVMFPREIAVNWLVRNGYGNWEWLLALNPMYGIIEAYRGLMLGMPWHSSHLAISTAVSCALFVFGLFYFRKTERRFADIA